MLACDRLCVSTSRARGRLSQTRDLCRLLRCRDIYQNSQKKAREGKIVHKEYMATKSVAGAHYGDHKGY